MLRTAFHAGKYAVGAGAGGCAVRCGCEDELGARRTHLKPFGDEPATLFSARGAGALSERVSESALVATRAFDVARTACVTLVDYSLVDKSDKVKLSAAHKRAAERLRSLGQTHGGMLCKFGQHVSSLQHVVPPEFSETLSVLTDRQPSSISQDVSELLLRELGPERMARFESFEPLPVASASIAQVHRAVLKPLEGEDHLPRRTVAVKIMHPGLERRVRADFAAMRFGVAAASFMYPKVAEDWAWLLPEFEDAVALELDFVQEAATAERAKALLANAAVPRGSRVSVPDVLWNMTTRRVLTMAFAAGHRVDDAAAHAAGGVRPREVANALVMILAGLACEHGLVHADPHGGNALVETGPNGTFTLHLLDHGLYRRLEPTTRRALCELWEGLATRDGTTAGAAGVRLGLGDDAESALAVAMLLLTSSTSASPTQLGAELDAAARAALRAEIEKRLPTSADAAALLRRVPRDLLFTMRATSLLRGTHRKLDGRRRDRYLLFAEAAARGAALPQRFDAVGDREDSLLPRNAAAAIRERRVRRPSHPLNHPTSSERARVSPFRRRLLNLHARWRVVMLYFNIVLAEVLLRLRLRDNL